eukprot:CAMPEP_0171061210 /NCGR_PEP_ID=MMETSP0766_2-20121228/4295_1 /TAXON_ID=439317 /ORGANISM="Gambierdiscus australes, Strain CAWD 149" /LENGTH=35 /DNA_ID= /DNA_START= /DNA_END= /DNA_ORIENTATION=
MGPAAQAHQRQDADTLAHSRSGTSAHELHTVPESQ